MKKFTKHFLSLALITGIMGLPLLVGAQWTGADPGSSGLAATDADTLLSNILNTILGLLAILAVFGFVISGIMFITAGGDDGRVESAKKWLIYSIIGLVVALIGYIVVNFISGILTGA